MIIRKQLFFSLFLIIVMTKCGNRNKESDAYGNFEAVEIIVSSQAEGEVVELHLEEGEEIDKSEFVGLIDTTSLSLKKQQLLAQLEASSANIMGQEKRIEAQEQTIENLLKQQNRLQRMNREKAVTDQELDNITTKVTVAQKNLEAAIQQKQSILFQRKAIQIQLAQLEERIAHCIITNPVKGTVLEKYIEEYELVVPGKPLYKIANLKELILRTYVSGAQLPQLKIGEEVEVLVDKDKRHNQSFTGRITWISFKAEFTPKMIQTKEERVSQVYAIKVKVNNDGTIKIGMPGEVRFYQNRR